MKTQITSGLEATEPLSNRPTIQQRLKLLQLKLFKLMKKPKTQMITSVRDRPDYYTKGIENVPYSDSEDDEYEFPVVC